MDTRKATSRYKPRALWMYDVNYFDRSELERLGEFEAPTYSTRLSAEDLQYFILTPYVVIRLITLDYGTVFF